MSNLTYSTGLGNIGTGNQTLLDNPELCTLDTCDLSLSPFDYVPSLGGNAIFAAILGLCLVAQIYLGVRHRIWGYMGAMVLGLVLEVIGYVGRIMLNGAPFINNNFLIYLVCLTIAPALLTASIYLCLARIVVVYGESLSRFRPRTYTIVFCTCDLICLLLQAAGGGIASSATTTANSDMGRYIMLAGLIFQVVSLSLFTICCADFAFRVMKNREQMNQKHLSIVNSLLFKSFLVGLFVATLTIFLRSLYRCVELAGGFNGNIFRSHEEVFMILEPTMITIAVLCLTVLHPGISFQGVWHEANFKLRVKKAEKDVEGTAMETVGYETSVAELDKSENRNNMRK